MKTCPFCAEEVQDVAIKCRFCGEMLPEAGDPSPVPPPLRPSQVRESSPQKDSNRSGCLRLVGTVGSVISLFIVALMILGWLVGDSLPSGIPSGRSQGVIVQPPEPQIGKWEGFRGIRWGTRAANVAGLWNKQEEADFDSYQRIGDSLTIGDATILSVLYVFHDNEFSGAQVQAKGESNFLILKDIMIKRYGEPKGLLQTSDKLYWEEYESSSVGAYMSLDFDDTDGTATLIYIYKPFSSRKGRTGDEDL